MLFFLSLVLGAAVEVFADPLLPGLDHMAHGFDAVRGTTQNVLSVLSFDNTSRYSKKWTNPYTSVSFSVPDMVFVAGISSSEVQHSVYHSVEEYVSSQQESAGASVKFGSFFTASARTSKALQIMNQGSTLLGETECTIDLYRIMLSTPRMLTPSPAFLAAASKLPSTYDEGTYVNFVKQYGTHYISSATAGGIARLQTAVSKSFYDRKTDSSVSAQMQAKWFDIGGGGSYGSSTKSQSADWKSHTSSTLYLSGGSTSSTFTNSQEWDDWIHSVKDISKYSPNMRETSIEPIWILLNNTSVQVKQNLQKAVAAYASGKTWPGGVKPSGYPLSWCNCQSVQFTPWQFGEYQIKCPPQMYLSTLITGPVFGTHGEYSSFSKEIPQMCCKPCIVNDT